MSSRRAGRRAHHSSLSCAASQSTAISSQGVKPRDCRRHAAKLCHLAIYPSPVRPPGRCPCAARIHAAMPQSLRHSRPSRVSGVTTAEHACRATAPMCHTTRALRPGASWAAATMVGREAAQQWAAGTAVQAGHELGRWGFSPVAFELFFYFPNIFKSLQIQKFV
jgi:hypothetical protein